MGANPLLRTYLYNYIPAKGPVVEHSVIVANSEANINCAKRCGVTAKWLNQMTDYPTLTRQAALMARIGSLSERVASRIVTLPKDKREAGLVIVHDNYTAELKENGLDNEHGRKWLNLQIEEIRRLITEIEASGDQAEFKDSENGAMPTDDSKSA